MITLYNNLVKVSSSSPILSHCKNKLRVTEYSKSTKDLVTYYLYDRAPDGGIRFFSGLTYLVPEVLDHKYDKIVDRRVDTLSIDHRKFTDEYLSKLLPGITLRADQVLSIRKILANKKGILQLSTGAGKTEIFAAVLKLLNNELGYIPDTLILEPSLYLVKSTVSRLNKYGIDAHKLLKNNYTYLSKILVTHPRSLSRLVEDNPHRFNKVKIIISDEGHHLQAKTWQQIMNASSSLEYSLAFSATVFDSSNYDINSLKNISHDEALVIQATGKLLIDIPPSYYISNKVLAHPKLYRLLNQANEYSSLGNNWTKLNKYVIESSARTKLVSDCAAFMSINKFKVLILVSTKRHALKIIEYLAKLGLKDKTRCSFGTGKFYGYDCYDQSGVVDVSELEDTMELYSQGKLLILVGTSHIYEGADIPNLDSVILAGGGRGVRRLIQGIGRALRITKTGNYAHIIDFTDLCSGVLSYQSSLRLSMYERLVNNNKSDIYDNLSFGQFKEVFMMNEFDTINKGGTSK